MLNEGPAPERLEDLRKRMKAYEEDANKKYAEQQVRLSSETAASEISQTGATKSGQKVPRNPNSAAHKGESDDEDYSLEDSHEPEEDLSEDELRERAEREARIKA
jgi:hypothetical protein